MVDEELVDQLVFPVCPRCRQELDVLGRNHPEYAFHKQIAFVADPVRASGYKVLRIPKKDPVSHVSGESFGLLTVLRDPR